MKFIQLLTESGITLGNKAYPREGQIVIICGGSGSGKSHVTDNLLLLDGKVLDTDNIKSLVLKISKRYSELLKSDKYKLKFQNFLSTFKPNDVAMQNRIKELDSLEQIDLENPPDVSILHFFCASLGLDLNQKYTLFGNLGEHLPNIIFDVTLRNLDILTLIYSLVIPAYDPKNIHLVWVLTPAETALKRNLERGRNVSQKVLMATHKGVSETLKEIFKDLNTRIPKTNAKVLNLIDGDIWIVPNADSDFKEIESPQGNTVVLSQVKFKVKESGKPLDGLSKALDKINDYVPSETKWDI